MTDEGLRAAYRPILAHRPESRAGCPDADELRALAEQQGVEADRLRTLDHVMACASCKEEYDLLAALARVPEPHHSRRREWSLAAAAVAVLAVGGGAYWSLRGGGDEPVRGDRGRLIPVAPAEGATLAAGAPVALVWRAMPGAVEYSVEVLEAGGTLRFGGSTSDTTLAVPDSVRLSAGGGYRWWVRTTLGDGTVARSPLVLFQVSR